MDTKTIFLFAKMCKKINILIDLSYIVGKIMIKLNKMQIFIFDYDMTSYQVIFDHSAILHDTKQPIFA